MRDKIFAIIDKQTVRPIPNYDGTKLRFNTYGEAAEFIEDEGIDLDYYEIAEIDEKDVLR